MMDEETARDPVRELVKEKSVTMEYFLETSHLDATTAEMLKKYDKDGNGSFSKDEVVAIVLDLREAMHSNELLGKSNTMFKRLFLVVTAFSLLLLTSIFGLSYAVAALTANTDVRSDGLMLTKDGSAVIATDNVASEYSVGPNSDGVYCLSLQEGGEIIFAAKQGRNVLLTVGDEGGVEHTLSMSANGMEHVGDAYCFWNAETQSQNCLTYVSGRSCVAHDASGRRKLEQGRELQDDQGEDEDDEGLTDDEILALCVAGGYCQNPDKIECFYCFTGYKTQGQSYYGFSFP
jgi:hypothetical protein